VRGPKQFKIVKTPIQRPSRMSQESQLLLKTLFDLEEGTSIRFKCADYNEAFRTAKTLIRFIYDARKSRKLSGKFSVRRRKEEGYKREVWFVYVARNPD